ncbi:VTT domain-containing protein [Sediminicoccus rosea]|uniref:TVP38/TMEM64 family membrane protein n=1 Tax=Sediminicoccus rosea TaxID=1225128 RepID=A0ABZ0PC47_9PROT|nr:VTT domain-containing protein [Sediminicoccus rosea]WPB83162.1 VTT domain-containing protein [Sediminicoccus rosea]
MTAAVSRWMLAAALATAGVVAFSLRDQFDLPALEAAVGGLGAWGALAFAALFATGTVLFLPGSIFGLAGGALFGPFWGTAVNLAGGTLGATLAFLVARHLAADWVARRAGGRLKQVIEGVEAEGWRFVALVRLVPAVPFNIANYALGLTRIPLGQYVLATAISMLPGTAAYAWLGHAGRSALAGGDEAAIRYGLLGLAALAAIALLPRLIRRVLTRPAAAVPEWTEPAALAEAIAGSDPPTVIDVRSPDEFTGPLGHIPGAINLPVDALVADPGLTGAARDRPTVLVCLTDRRSSRAAAILLGAGHQRLTVLRGGMKGWNAAGLPVGGTTVPAEATPREKRA